MGEKKTAARPWRVWGLSAEQTVVRVVVEGPDGCGRQTGEQYDTRDTVEAHGDFNLTRDELTLLYPPRRGRRR